MPIELKVPEVGESVTEVYIGEWHKAEGDRVEQDEDIVELESEKATFDAPAPSAGVLNKILKQTGETADVGEVIAYIEESSEKGESAAKTGTGKQKKAASTKKSEKAPTQTAEKKARKKAEPRDASRKEERQSQQPQAAEARGEPHVMPAAQRLLQQHGLQADDIEATGPGGRLLKEDILRHVEEGTAEETDDQSRTAGAEFPRGEPGREEEAVPMSPLRRRIAQRLVKAQQTAALLTTFNEIDLSAVQALRAEYREAFREKYDIKLGIMSFFVKAAIDALKQFPQLNAEIRDNDIVYHNYYDIGIAVGTGKGLVVPVLRNAEQMSFAEVEAAINDLGRRAQDGKLSVQELQGGTFTISNGGIYGSLLSTPIVNPPQSGVLGMHTIQERPVVRNGEIVVRPMMYVALTYDHRIVDGREAVTCLRRIKEAVENPARMLIEV